MPYVPPTEPLTRTEKLVTDTMYGIVSGTYVGGVVAYCVEECAQLLEDKGRRTSAMVLRGISGASGGALATTSLLHVGVFAKTAFFATTFFASCGGTLALGAAAGIGYALKYRAHHE